MSDEIDFQQLQHDAERGLFPKLADSSVYISLAPENPDVKFCLELGAMIMFDKPLLVVARVDQVLPEKLVQLADKVIRVDMSTDEGMESMQQQVTEFYDSVIPRDDT